jgi:predicted metal-dependent TIM-barrel fold hydrolase
VRIPIFDPHCHPDGRNANDYEAMALAGVEKILAPCSGSGERRHDGRAWAERFDRLLRERERAACFGIELVVALAVNAADLASHEAALAGLAELAARLDRPEVVAVGELALRTFSAAEEDLFVRQLELARQAGLPVLIEAPVPTADFHRMLALLRRELEAGRIAAERVCLLDLDAEKLAAAAALDLGGYGLPVSPPFDGPFTLRRKVGPCDLPPLLAARGARGLMLNSGLHYGFADPLCLPRSVLRLRLQGVADEVLVEIAYANAQRMFLPS